MSNEQDAVYRAIYNQADVDYLVEEAKKSECKGCSCLEEGRQQMVKELRENCIVVYKSGPTREGDYIRITMGLKGELDYTIGVLTPVKAENAPVEKRLDYSDPAVEVREG